MVSVPSFENKSDDFAIQPPLAGKVVSKGFSYSPAEVAQLIARFKSPRAVYESGVTGFYLVRTLRDLSIDFIVGAVSKMRKPAADKRMKNDRNGTKLLAHQLAARNIVEVWVSDEECEGARLLE